MARIRSVKVALSQLELALVIAAVDFAVHEDVALSDYQPYLDPKSKSPSIEELRAARRAGLEKLREAQKEFRPW
jgi:hypothetical protein